MPQKAKKPTKAKRAPKAIRKAAGKAVRKPAAPKPAPKKTAPKKGQSPSAPRTTRKPEAPKPAKKASVAKKAKKAKTIKTSVPKPARKDLKAQRPMTKKSADQSVAKEARRSAARAKKPEPVIAEAEPKPKSAMLPREFLVDLASAIRQAVLPSVEAAKGREVIGQAVSGDATFELDRLAERALVAFLKQAKMPVAYYSEDEGYATFSSAQPQNLLVVDPIDGSRAAKSGFEGCVIAVASTRVIERPRIGDVDNACVMEILGNRCFVAQRGKGARIVQDGHIKRPRLSKNVNLESISWTMTVPARPAELIFPTAARLIDLSSLKGGFFACNSTSFSLTRLLTNQLDACVDFANRFYRDMPDVVKDHFINAGRGNVLGIAPYDIAASLLVAQEAGCIVTDAYGAGFEEVLLLDSGEANQCSLIAAASVELHQKLMAFFDHRIQQLETLLRRRAERQGA
ncbi:MAG TPA: inositol monophosphatase family protein [Candidatus Hydrogenedentes bacterium]|nr:inositol monophosphatase family protein [Candidatus Hydrogenedentota bacterium]